jgi:hypothetical protein
MRWRTLNAYEDGTVSKFRNVGTKSSDAGRLHKRHNMATNENFSERQRLKWRTEQTMCTGYQTLPTGSKRNLSLIRCTVMYM